MKISITVLFSQFQIETLNIEKKYGHDSYCLSRNEYFFINNNPVVIGEFFDNQGTFLLCDLGVILRYMC